MQIESIIYTGGVLRFRDLAAARDGSDIYGISPSPHNHPGSYYRARIYGWPLLPAFYWVTRQLSGPFCAHQILFRPRGGHFLFLFSIVTFSRSDFPRRARFPFISCFAFPRWFDPRKSPSPHPHEFSLSCYGFFALNFLRDPPPRGGIYLPDPRIHLWIFIFNLFLAYTCTYVHIYAYIHTYNAALILKHTFIMIKSKRHLCICNKSVGS